MVATGQPLTAKRSEAGQVKTRSNPGHGWRRQDLQGMRALAVLVAVLYHVFDWPRGGFVGVEIFFVLSGFFITRLLIRERTTTGRLSFQDFYIRRVKRILPTALLVLVVTVAASELLFTAIRAKTTLVDALYAAVFAANYHFEQTGTDYFEVGQPPSPIQHYWSLSVEEQFYFVWPALLVLIYALTRGLRRNGHTWARQAGLFGAMSVVVAASFAFAVYFTAHDPTSAYFSTFSRIWELGTGALVAIAGPWLARMPQSIRPALAYLGLGAVVASLFMIDATVPFPAPWGVVPVLGTALVVAAFQGVEVRGMYPLTNPVARYIGDTSYTLYLWHWPVIVLLMTLMPRGVLFDVIALVSAAVLTVVTYHFFENPIRTSNWLTGDEPSKSSRFALTRTGLACVVVVSVMAIGGSIFAIQYNEKTARTSQADQQLVVASEAPKPQDADPCFGAPAMVTEGCVLRNPAVPLQPSIDAFANDTQGAYACFRLEHQPLKSCTYGYSGDDATRIAIVGDSHAGMILPALSQFLMENKWELTTYVGWGCQWQTPAEGDCPIDDIQSSLLKRPYDLVITTSARKFGKAESMQRAWEPVAAAGSRIAVIGDNPAVSEESIACLTRVSTGDDRTGDCGTPVAEAFAKPDPLVEVAGLVPNTTLIDLTRYYCNADRCPTVIGNVIVYRDTIGGHLTATYVKTLGPAIVDGIKRALVPH